MRKFLQILTFWLCLVPVPGQSAPLPETETELLYAIRKGDVARTKQLLSAFDGINRPLLPHRPQTTLLMYAVSKNADIKIIDLLLQSGANPLLVDSQGRPVIVLTALEQENLPVLERLLDNVPQPQLNKLLLITIAQRRSPQIIKMLLAHGADADCSHSTGLTPLIMAAAQPGKGNEISKLLTEAGADPQKRFLGVTAGEIALAGTKEQ